MTSPTLYLPLDVTGLSPENLIALETQKLLHVRDLRLCKPSFGAFFGESLKVYSTSATGVNTLLTRGVQYTCIEFLSKQTQEYGQEVYLAILISDQNLPDDFKLTYQALGGSSRPDLAAVAVAVRDIALGGTATDWDLLLNKPRGFAPTPGHLTDVEDIYGFEYIKDGLDRIKEALAVTGVVTTYVVPNPNGIGTITYTQASVSHPIDAYVNQRVFNFKQEVFDALTGYNNDITAHINSRYLHGLTKTQVGLGNVENRGFSTIIDGSTVIEPYASPKRVRLINDQTPIQSGSQHIINFSNPHQVTPAQIGLSNILNYTTLINYTRNSGNTASYSTDYQTSTVPAYVGPYSAVTYMQDRATAYKTVKWITPLESYLNVSTGVFKQITDAIASAAAKVSSANTAATASEGSIVLYNTAMGQYTPEAREYRLIGRNAYFAKVLGSLTLHDFTKRGSVLGRVYDTPRHLSGLEFWIDALDTASFTTTAGPGTNLITITDKCKGRAFTAVGTVVNTIGTNDSGFTFLAGSGYLQQTLGVPLYLKPGMTVIVVRKSGADGTTLPILSHRTSSSSGLSDTSIIAHGPLRKSLEVRASNGWLLAKAPNASSLSTTMMINILNIGTSVEADSWLGSSTQPDVAAYPRGLQAPADSSWPASNYLSESLNTIGSDDSTIQQSGSIGEIMIYNRQLSQKECLALIDYLGCKRSITSPNLDFVYNAFHHVR